ncbi:MAG: TRASH domain-containing protein [Candidatus Thiodiazotropha sp. (ex Notomyrtea botanica)]|nr:TRASH domain-containing protein [Candidatus Thiodiazotropha sp. (ex Notomyrtea botanica)]
MMHSNRFYYFSCSSCKKSLRIKKGALSLC